MPREPTLAEPHDRHPIKEYNDLPILRYFPACPPSQYPPSIPPSLPPFIPPSFPLSLCTLINFQTHLFIVQRCLSAEETGRMDPFLPTRLTSLWLWKWPGIIHQPPPSTLHLFREEEQPPQSLYFLDHFSLSHFTLQAVLTSLRRGSWCRRGRCDLGEGVKVGLLIPKGSRKAGLLSRTAHRRTESRVEV